MLAGFGALKASERSEPAKRATPAAYASSALKPLPPGTPRRSSVEGTVGPVTVEELQASSDTIFVGTAVARGGSEVLSPDEPGVSALLTAHRIRFDVRRTLRGTPATKLDVTAIDVADNADPYVLGRTYLVFARHARLGVDAVDALVTNGAYQGAFEVVGREIARNRWLGEVNVGLVARAVREGP